MNNTHSFSNLFLLKLVLLACSGMISAFSPTQYFTSRIRNSHRGEESLGTNSHLCHSGQPHALTAHLITFDLDDTIFPVGPVVADANKALFSHLSSLGCGTTQDEFLATTKQIRTELAAQNQAITYTELRQRAIRKELIKHLKNEDEESIGMNDERVVGSYNLWEDNRHLAAEKHLYPDTIQMLKELKKNHEGVVIAAITNGKGNPLKMESIKAYFDFCVSGEDDDVFPLRKPSAGIYEVALKRFKEINDLGEQEEICWIHVGDDLANDVGASATCGAKTIWVDLEEGYGQTASARDPNAPQPAWSTATKEELEKRKKMNEEAQVFVSERVTTLSDLPTAVEKISNSILQSIETN
jgi:FMN phosphatase YigB (HAD superfamily)